MINDSFQIPFESPLNGFHLSLLTGLVSVWQLLERQLLPDTASQQRHKHTHTHTSACTHTHVVMNNPWWSKGQEPCVWKINSTQGLMTAGKKENRKAEARETDTHIPLSDCISVRECGVLQLSGSVRVRENYLRWHENCCLYSWLRKQQCCVCLYDDILLARRAQRVFPDVFFFTFW